MDVADQTLVEVGSVRFIVLLFASPLVTAVTLAAGLIEKRIELLLFGVFFLAMSVMLAVLYFKYYRGEDDDAESEEQAQSFPPLLRRM